MRNSLYVIFSPQKSLKLLQFLNNIKACNVFYHDCHNCLSCLELVVQSEHLRKSQNLTFPTVLSQNSAQIQNLTSLHNRGINLVIYIAKSAPGQYTAHQRFFTDHLFIKSPSAVLCSFRKLGHKITISQFVTTVA